MNRKVRFGIIGCGSIASVHAKAILNIEDAKLVAVSSRDKEKARSLSYKYLCNCCDYDEILIRPDIDVVTICLPSGLQIGRASCRERV